MKKYNYISFTAGRGPQECGLAVQGIQRRFQHYLRAQNIPFEISAQQAGNSPDALETIVFKIEKRNQSQVEPWLGTIQWICKSPLRKNSKRKNWYIKCCEVQRHENQTINMKDITVQVYKASGAGGQHRNKVETAIRIIHQPTGILVTASEMKSKEQNRKRALEKLEAKLALRARERRDASQFEEWSSKLEIVRGNPVKVFQGLKFKEVNKNYA